MIEDLSRYPDWTVQVANTPAVITCTDVMAEEHPELVVTYMKAMIKVGRWANEHKHAAAVDPRPADVLPRRRGHLPRASSTSTWCRACRRRTWPCIEIGKDFMVSHGYIKNDFDVDEWAAPEFLETAAEELIEERWKKVTTEKLPEASELLASATRLG